MANQNKKRSKRNIFIKVIVYLMLFTMIMSTLVISLSNFLF